MSDELSSVQLMVYKRRPPLFWHRWDVTPYLEFRAGTTSDTGRLDKIPDRLDRTLSRRRTKLPDPVRIGATCESYPASEKKKRITRRCLEVIAKHGCPVILSTGSSLLLRDIDLLREIHEDSQVTVSVRMPLALFAKTNRNSQAAKSRIALLERVCRSGIQTGITVEKPEDENFQKRRFVPFFQMASEIGVDFINIPCLKQSGKDRQGYWKIKLTARKSILQLSHEYKVRLVPKRYLPKDSRHENFWLAETLANHAFFLEMSGVNAAGHWAAARRIDNFDGDVRLWALRGELIPLTSNNPGVRLDLERFLRGERISTNFGLDI